MTANQESRAAHDAIEIQSEMQYAGFRIRLLGSMTDVVTLSTISWGVFNPAYFIGCWAWRGQTLGQLVTKVRVVRTNGEPVNLRTAGLRFFGCIVCALTLGVGFLTIAFDDRKQGLHDKIAGTYVVSLPDE